MGRTTTAQCRGASTLLLYTVSIPSLRKRKGGREEGRKEGRQEEKKKREKEKKKAHKANGIFINTMQEPFTNSDRF